jgi:threonine dehydratase
MPTLKEIYHAKRVVGRYLKRTPLIYSQALSELLDCSVYLKLENLQPIRAFKVRGGVYYVYVKRDEARERGLITASTGNHGQSIAYAGRLFGADVTIVMPQGISEVKVRSLERLGANIIYHGRIFEEAREYAERLADERNMLYVHPVNEPLLYRGVATMHLENIEDLPDVDVVINPIGGGSGAIGAVSVYKRLSSDIKVFGVQAEGAKSFYLSWKEGRLISTGKADTIAEGLATAQAYEYPLKILRGRLDDIILVSDSDMMRAMRLLLESVGQVVEPAGAASTAAAFKIRDLLRGKNVILMVTGGNVDMDLFKEIIGMNSD